MNKAARTIFIVNVVLVGILLIGLVRILITGGRYFFPLELIGFLLLAALTALAVAGFRKGWGNALVTGVLLLYLANLLLIWLFKGKLYVVLLLLSLVGLLLGIVSLFWRRSREEESVAAPVSAPAQSTSPQKSASTTFIPGKYVASKTSNYYHAPTCEWAKKIIKSRQVWFNDKKEAWEKGLKKHECVE